MILHMTINYKLYHVTSHMLHIPIYNHWISWSASPVPNIPTNNLVFYTVIVKSCC